MPNRFLTQRSNAMIAATVVGIVAATALLGTIGADARWLAALGHVIAHRHSIPAGVPFAADQTTHWANPLVLAELAFYWLERAFGDRGLLLAQLLAVTGAVTMLAHDARNGGADSPGTCAALLLAALGAVSSFTVVRVQLFSLLLFPVLVVLLRAQERSPSRRIWLVVPLLAVWANLHGVVLLGLAVTLGYLACSRARREPTLAVCVGVASMLALCLTPALADTPAYYHGLLTNMAVQRGQGEWGPLSLSAPLDLVLIASAAVLLVRIRGARPRLWEWIVIAALVGLTIHGSRNGVWLLMFVAPLAARTIRPARTWSALALPTIGVSLVAIVFALARGPLAGGASPAIVNRALALANGSPVLAEDQAAEQVALAGGRISVGDPIDAFSRQAQIAYLNWLDGSAAGRSALTPHVRVVLVSRGSQAQTLMADTPGFNVADADRTTEIYERDAPLAVPPTVVASRR